MINKADGAAPAIAYFDHLEAIQALDIGSNSLKLLTINVVALMAGVIGELMLSKGKGRSELERLNLISSLLLLAVARDATGDRILLENRSIRPSEHEARSNNDCYS